MDFGFSSENAMIRKAIREWVNKECPKDLVRDMDENWQHPGKLLSKLVKLGFYGLNVEEKYGGEGKNVQAVCLIIMEIATRYPALGRCYSNSALGAMLFSNWGSREQKETYLPKLVEAKIRVATKLGGTDFSPQETKIKGEWDAVSNSYILNGTVDYVENADQSEVVILPVETNNSERNEIFYMLIDKDTAGIQCHSGPERIGHKGINACRVQCDNCKVPLECVLSGNSSGNLEKQHSMLRDLALLLTSFEAVGIAKGAYSSALDYVKHRVQFSRPIGKFPAIKRMISEMLKDIHASELLSFKTAWKADQGQIFTQESAVSAWTSICTAQKVSQEGLQLFGGYGYTMEYDIQRYFRDVTILMNSNTSYESLSHRIAKSTGLS